VGVRCLSWGFGNGACGSTVGISREIARCGPVESRCGGHSPWGRADGSCTTGLPQRPSGVCAPSLAPGPRGRGLIVVHGSGAGAKIGERIGWLESVMRAGL
jgi:hypothetical protein